MVDKGKRGFWKWRNWGRSHKLRSLIILRIDSPSASWCQRDMWIIIVIISLRSLLWFGHFLVLDL